MPHTAEKARYVAYFRSQIAVVGSLAADPGIAAGFTDPAHRVAMHKKILYPAIVDSPPGPMRC